MGHAHHFLTRLDRLNDARHLEDAKRLYNDVGILRLILAHADLPSGCERIAISLAHPVDGPWVITTRSGKFVTCLAEGMRPSASVARVPPQLLQNIKDVLAQVSSYIDAFARYRSRSGLPKEEALLGWVLKRPERVAREDARALAGLTLLAPHLIEKAIAATEAQVAKSTFEQALTREPRVRNRVTAGLHATRLSLAHLLAAVSAAPEVEAGSAEPLPTTPSVLRPAERFLADSPPVAVRGLWALRKYLDLDAECVEVLSTADPRCDARRTFTVGLASLIANANVSRAARLERLRRLVAALPAELRDGPLVHQARHTLSDLVASAGLAVEMGRAVHARILCGYADEEVAPADCDSVSDKSALATFYTFPHSRTDESTGILPWLVAAMPHFLHAPFEELYLPTAELEAVRAASSRARPVTPSGRERERAL